MAPTSTFSLLLLINLVLTDLSTLAVADNTSQAYLDLHNASRVSVRAAPIVFSLNRENYALNYSPSQRSQCESLTHSGGPYGENLY